MEIDYTNARVDYIIHSRFASPAYSRVAFSHYYWVAYWGVMAGLGVYVSLFSGFIFLAAIFVSMYLIYFVNAVPYSRVLKAGAERTLLHGALKKIRLRIDDDGLHETIENQI